MERPSVRRLREEIQQTKPFHDRAHAAGIALVRTADEGRRTFESLVTPHGVSIEQYNVLRILRGAGDAGLPTLAIRERMIEEAAGMTISEMFERFGEAPEEIDGGDQSDA